VREPIIDKRGLRLAREIRKAIKAREDDEELAAAIEVYDRAVTPEERQAAAAFLVIHTTTADSRYSAAVSLALMRVCSPELLPEDER
jgi:hypothetical protein